MPGKLRVPGAFVCSNMPLECAARTQRVMDVCTASDLHHDLILLRTDQFLISNVLTRVTLAAKGLTALQPLRCPQPAFPAAL
jgi:hypothetical protein